MAESSGNGWKCLGCFYTTCFTKCKDLLQRPLFVPANYWISVLVFLLVSAFLNG